MTSNNTTSPEEDLDEGGYTTILSIARAFLSIVLLIFSFWVIKRDRTNLFPDPIYNIWLSVFVTRIGINITELHLIGVYLPIWVKDTLFCRIILHAIGTCVQFAYALQILMLCVYQLIVLSSPVKYYVWRNSDSFSRKITFLLVVSWIYSMLHSLLSNTAMATERCMSVVRRRPRAQEDQWIVLPTSVYLLGALLYFAVLLLTALLYIVVTLVTVAKRKKMAELTDQQNAAVKAMVKISLAGGISFLCSFLFIFWYVLGNGTSLYTTPASSVFMLLMKMMDNGGDPLLLYWRNSTFRLRVNDILGIRSKAVYSVSTTAATAGATSQK